MGYLYQSGVFSEVLSGGVVNVVPVLTAPFSLSISNNQSVVAAVTGKKIKVLGYLVQSNSATNGAYVFKSGSGGTILTGQVFAPKITDPWPGLFPISEVGYFETAVGVGLFADCGSATVVGHVIYIAYTP